MRLYYTLPLACLLFASCHSSDSSNSLPATDKWTPPPAGTVVASDSMATKDKLNAFYFAVKLTVSYDNGNAGNYGFVYDLEAHDGPNDAMTKITMPKGGKNLRPLLRKSGSGLKYIIGFIPDKDMGGDGTFKEFYSVSSTDGAIEIKPLKGYSFE